MSTRQKYSFTVQWSDEDECYIATCSEFPGLSAFAEDPAQAVEEAKVALEGFIEVYEEEGRALPSPSKVREYSGQVRLRLPATLHQVLAEESRREGVSMNTLMISYLSCQYGKASVTEEVLGLLKSYQDRVSASLEQIHRTTKRFRLELPEVPHEEYDPHMETLQELHTAGRTRQKQVPRTLGEWKTYTE